MADKTREETVKENDEAVTTKWGEENYDKIFAQLLRDINISLAMLVDKQA